MSISFSCSNDHNPADICCVCLDPLGETEGIVAHDGATNEPKLHAAHITCLHKWVKIHPTCPMCRKVVNLTSLLSRRERVISAIKRSCLSCALRMVVIVAGAVVCLNIGIASGVLAGAAVGTVLGPKAALPASLMAGLYATRIVARRLFSD